MFNVHLKCRLSKKMIVYKHTGMALKAWGKPIVQLPICAVVNEVNARVTLEQGTNKVGSLFLVIPLDRQKSV